MVGVKALVWAIEMEGMLPIPLLLVDMYLDEMLAKMLLVRLTLQPNKTKQLVIDLSKIKHCLNCFIYLYWWCWIWVWICC